MQPSLSPTPPEGQEFLPLPPQGLHLALLEEPTRLPSSLLLLGVFYSELCR